MSWLDASGEHSDIVLSTRIRLARNVEGFAFTSKARDGERLRVLAQLRDAMANLGITEPCRAALANLGEALALYFTPPVATALPDLRPVEVEIGAA